MDDNSRYMGTLQALLDNARRAQELAHDMPTAVHNCLDLDEHWFAALRESRARFWSGLGFTRPPTQGERK